MSQFTIRLTWAIDPVAQHHKIPRLAPLIGMNVAQETTRSQALPLCLGTHWCGGSCLPSSQTKDAFRRGGASLALSYQAEPQSLVTRLHSATKLAIRATSA